VRRQARDSARATGWYAPSTSGLPLGLGLSDRPAPGPCRCTASGLPVSSGNAGNRAAIAPTPPVGDTKPGMLTDTRSMGAAGDLFLGVCQFQLGETAAAAKPGPLTPTPTPTPTPTRDPDPDPDPDLDPLVFSSKPTHSHPRDCHPLRDTTKINPNGQNQTIAIAAPHHGRLTTEAWGAAAALGQGTEGSLQPPTEEGGHRSPLRRKGAGQRGGSGRCKAIGEVLGDWGGVGQPGR
jgi:hypothetical protein